MTDSKDYITTDFYTAAVLISQGFDIQDITRSPNDPSKKVFHFEDSPELQAVRKAYISGKLEGNIRAFKNAIEEVKSHIHS